MYNPDDVVRHHDFGTGTVRSVNLDAGRVGTALVEWDTHRVVRETKQLSMAHSHVGLQSLSLIQPDGDNHL